MWWGSYPWGMAGSSTTRSGALAAARSQISVTILRSVSTGRWGPWSSRVATGTRATRSSPAARRTSGQVRRSYRNGPSSDHTGQVHLRLPVLADCLGAAAAVVGQDLADGGRGGRGPLGDQGLEPGQAGQAAPAGRRRPSGQLGVGVVVGVAAGLAVDGEAGGAGLDAHGAAAAKGEAVAVAAGPAGQG